MPALLAINNKDTAQGTYLKTKGGFWCLELRLFVNLGTGVDQVIKGTVDHFSDKILNTSSLHSLYCVDRC